MCMQNQPLIVYALESAAPPLRSLLEALQDAGFAAAEFGVRIAGEASEEELSSPVWEAAFLRWRDPETHEVVLIERDRTGEDEEADRIVAEALRQVTNSSDLAGQMIVADHLRRTHTVYAAQILPALLTDDDHPAWAALDILLRCLAALTNGLIYVESEGYCDADGEMLLAELDEEMEEPKEA